MCCLCDTPAVATNILRSRCGPSVSPFLELQCDGHDIIVCLNAAGADIHRERIRLDRKLKQVKVYMEKTKEAEIEEVRLLFPFSYIVCCSEWSVGY